ncbi:ribosomal protein L30 (nucleomorph) [Bigelowiella natans]|uniref:Ribosomal protein L30 n=1 Tax=Bigelowiella natans TaxID=227086 RepID=Q3LWG3_BIGNA|nr:ribosomal protein L30 [Bigelowiella natans]ABA27202.1 ribosomal protein L30 [Bigelowiella natans]|mmetsp:Transcript_8002/g.9740  ORF Transcript_8002/g.9740 Transcript_8002/m.9740 type:complete len:103 (-) Transcript_8002:2116-2424(-)
MCNKIENYNIKLSNDQIILFFKTIKKKNNLVKGKKETIKNLISNKISFLIIASNCLIDTKLHIFHYCLLYKVKFCFFSGNSKELGQLCDLKHKACILGILRN